MITIKDIEQHINALRKEPPVFFLPGGNGGYERAMLDILEFIQWSNNNDTVN